MEEKLNQLKEILAEVADIRSALAVLDWDQQTYMPAGSSASRGQQISTLSRLAHVKFTSSEVGQLLEDLAPYARQLDPDSDEARLIKVTRRRYEKRTKVPASFVAELARRTSIAHNVWVEARRENKFAKFQPHLEAIVDLKRQYASFFSPYEHVYDPLLDDFEPGLKTAEVKVIFNSLRPPQVTLLREIMQRPQVDSSFLHQAYDEKKQWDFGVQVITRFGYDWDHGRQDKTVHPFTTQFGIDDVRITTRVYPYYLPACLFGTFHECGHGLYDLGFNPAFARSPLAGGASLGVHESQSRMYENLVGRSLPFWKYYYPILQQTFSSQLGDVDLLAFYKGINRVQPSLIRVEADEVTYNLHIMLRLELEIALMENTLEVKDLPEAWNTRMQEYVGVVPPTDAEGVLQDVHWSSGLVGYFSTYSLGNLISVQLWEAIRKDIPDLEAQFERGEFGALLVWLREKVHRHGAKLEPQELVQRVTGSKIDPAPYIHYLRGKYAAIYGF